MTTFRKRPLNYYDYLIQRPRSASLGGTSCPVKTKTPPPREINPILNNDARSTCNDLFVSNYHVLLPLHTVVPTHDDDGPSDHLSLSASDQMPTAKWTFSATLGITTSNYPSDQGVWGFPKSSNQLVKISELICWNASLAESYRTGKKLLAVIDRKQPIRHTSPTWRRPSKDPLVRFLSSGTITYEFQQTPSGFFLCPLSIGKPAHK